MRSRQVGEVDCFRLLTPLVFALMAPNLVFELTFRIYICFTSRLCTPRLRARPAATCAANVYGCCDLCYLEQCCSPRFRPYSLLFSIKPD